MADIKKDLLGLQYSTNFTLQGIEEADVSLNLTPVTNTSATVHGVVTDGTNPIPDATVKLFDSQGVPYKHTLTDSNGAYSLNNVPAGTYSIGVVKKGYRLTPTTGLTLSTNDTTEINLTTTADETLALGAIAGILTTTNNAPLANAKITLTDNSDNVVATTFTINDGEFAFYDLANGVYKLLATADGYTQSSAMTVTITNGSIANVTMSLSVDSRTYSGTVSGTIKNQAGTAIANCFVGLYQVVLDEHGNKTSETLVAVTKTNTSGQYMFGSVTGGNYVVKAKM